MELQEIDKGLFVFECDYEDRHLPKQAGFRWHPGDRCRNKTCKLCARGVGRVWWTSDLLRAQSMQEYAPDELRSQLGERAAPALARADEDTRAKRIAERVKKLEQANSLRASHAKDAKTDTPAPDGFEYLPYQRAAIAYSTGRPNTLLADEMGLGKTIEALGVVNATEGVERVLIVCPASLKLNWAREAERWLVPDLEVGIAGKKYPASAQVVIVNYEQLGKWEEELRGAWDVLIVDECHFVKNREAKRSKRVYALEASRKLFLTGTPILNRPVELYPIASLLCPDEFGHFWTFAKRYCKPMRTNFGWDFSGADHLDELHERLRSNIMIRRTKKDVLPDLPPKRRQVIELSSDHLKKLVKVEGEAWAEHKRRLSELRARSRESGAADSAELERLRQGVNLAFGELAKLRRTTALAKVPLVVEHLHNALESTHKIVVFAHHKDVIAELAEPFGENAVTLTGSTPTKARQAAVDRFQSDPSCALFIGSITAAGFGLTLTAASHVVFAELDWVPAYLTQAEDRTHRIGQKDSVLVQHLVLSQSLDARMVQTLLRKQRVVDEVTDGGAQADLFEDDLALDLIDEAERKAATE